MASGSYQPRKPRRDEMTGNEEQRLYKKAAKIRNASKGRRVKEKHKKRPHEWIEADPQEQSLQKFNSGQRQSLEAIVDDLLVEQKEFESEEQPSLEGEFWSGQIVGLSAGRCEVEKPCGQTIGCLLSKELRQFQQRDICIGDHVHVEERGESDHIDHIVTEVVPRQTRLARPDPLTGVERLLAANMDEVIVVAAAKNPPFKARLLDRFLIAIERGGAKARIVVNKTDLLSDEDAAELRKETLPYEQLGISVHYCSAEAGTGVDSLREDIAGKSCVLVGHSGVGKSSLLNAINPSLRELVGLVSGKNQKGKHTTTASRLVRWGNGSSWIDTPGIREFGLSRLQVDEVKAYFPELMEAAQQCRFNDCSHRVEPDCAVVQLVEEGTLSRARYDSYLRICDAL